MTQWHFKTCENLLEKTTYFHAHYIEIENVLLKDQYKKAYVP